MSMRTWFPNPKLGLDGILKLSTKNLCASQFDHPLPTQVIRAGRYSTVGLFIPPVSIPWTYSGAGEDLKCYLHSQSIQTKKLVCRKLDPTIKCILLYYIVNFFFFFLENPTSPRLWFHTFPCLSYFLSYVFSLFWPFFSAELFCEEKNILAFFFGFTLGSDFSLQPSLPQDFFLFVCSHG